MLALVQTMWLDFALAFDCTKSTFYMQRHCFFQIFFMCIRNNEYCIVCCCYWCFFLLFLTTNENIYKKNLHDEFYLKKKRRKEFSFAVVVFNAQHTTKVHSSRIENQFLTTVTMNKIHMIHNNWIMTIKI